MKWQLAGDWPAGPAVIPAGTILTGDVGPDGKLVFDNTAVSAPLPLNAVAQDTDAALQMCMLVRRSSLHRRMARVAFRPRHRS